MKNDTNHQGFKLKRAKKTKTLSLKIKKKNLQLQEQRKETNIQEDKHLWTSTESPKLVVEVQSSFQRIQSKDPKLSDTKCQPRTNQ